MVASLQGALISRQRKIRNRYYLRSFDDDDPLIGGDHRDGDGVIPKQMKLTSAEYPAIGPDHLPPGATGGGFSRSGRRVPDYVPIVSIRRRREVFRLANLL